MPDENLIGRGRASRFVGVPRGTLQAWTDAGIGPLPDDCGRYDRDELARWDAEMTAGRSLVAPQTGILDSDLRTRIEG